MKGSSIIYPLCLTALLFLNSARPVPGPDLGGVAGVDKVLHFFFFGLLATTWIRTSYFSSPRRLGWAWLLTVGIGALDEAFQSFSPYRTTDYLDLVADGLGAALAISVYHFWPTYRKILERKTLNWKAPTSTATESS